jgi:hypothetical protein
MGTPPIDWESIAYEYGYMYDDKVMLESLYKDLTMSELSSMLGVSKKSLGNRMNELGISRRPAGGVPFSRSAPERGPRFNYNKRKS